MISAIGCVCFCCRCGCRRVFLIWTFLIRMAHDDDDYKRCREMRTKGRQGRFFSFRNIKWWKMLFAHNVFAAKLTLFLSQLICTMICILGCTWLCLVVLCCTWLYLVREMSPKCGKCHVGSLDRDWHSILFIWIHLNSFETTMEMTTAENECWLSIEFMERKAVDGLNWLQGMATLWLVNWSIDWFILPIYQALWAPIGL